MRRHALDHCPTCGSGSFAPADFGLRRCTACSMVFAPEYADPSEIYVEGYFKGTTDFGLDVNHPRFQMLLLEVARSRLRALERCTGGPGRLLDVGAGQGEFMLGAIGRGWEVVGVDPEAEAAAYARDARRLDVRTTMLEDSELPERSFDAVSATHVLEHVPDARGFLRLIARWARPGGHVLIEVPNWASAQRDREQEGWRGLRRLEHLGHFTPDTLRRAFVEGGLEPVAITTPSYLAPEMSTTDEALDELALGRGRRAIRALSGTRSVLGQPAAVPRRAGWAALQIAERLRARAGRGAVVLGIARVP